MHIYSRRSCTAHTLPCISGILNTNTDVTRTQVSELGKHNIEKMKMQAQKAMPVLSVGIYSIDPSKLSSLQ